MIDMVVERAQLREVLIACLEFMGPPVAA